MNEADTNELTEYWNRETRYVNDKVDDALKDAQDHAYALGMKRGKEDANARLTVAAPDLLAALQELRYACTDKAEAMADAAIAKALGA
jgi:hypothetical protein